MFDVPFYPRISGKVGILGGSFDPAHEGHLHISYEVKKRLKLHQVWWLVTPHNPLKKSYNMSVSPFKQRVLQAQSLVKAVPWIKVVQLEKQLGTSYSFDTVSKLSQLYPDVHFIWIMGSDNFIHFDKWHREGDFIQKIPVVVCARNKQMHRAVRSKCGVRFDRQGIDFYRKRSFIGGGWSFLPIREYNISSTAIRAKRRWLGVWCYFMKMLASIKKMSYN